MTKSALLGQIALIPEIFPNIESIISTFRTPEFLSLSWRKRFKKINQLLCELIQNAPKGSFLLGAVLDYIERVNLEKSVKEPYKLASFEFWLNNFSDLSVQANAEIRSKIAGKTIPRSEYQSTFPIGMDRIYNGSHFVVAHLSPDVDAMVASFWGWLDAFAARVGTGIHQWCLPDGPPDSPFTNMFENMVGCNVFTHICRSTSSLTLTAMDMVTQSKLIKKPASTMTSVLNQRDKDLAIILTNEEGHYVGDWRPSDVELAGQVVIPFKSCLRWFENNLHTHLISTFAKKKLTTAHIPDLLSAIFDIKIKNCEPAQEFNEKQQKELNLFLIKVLGLSTGLESTFKELIQSLNSLSLPQMAAFQAAIEKISLSDLFDDKGIIREDRPAIFNQLEKLIHQLDQAILEARNYVDRLDVILKIKSDVLGIPQTYLTLRSDVEEMRNKIQNLEFLTVVIHELDDTLFPVGIVRAEDLRRNGLGTVSFRDFCNLEEVKMSSYFEIVSVIDHHKNSLKTTSVPLALIADVQSCNVLLAEQAFLINDKYSTGGMTASKINEQLQALASPQKPSEIRLLQRLLQRSINAAAQTDFTIHPQREYCEYLCFLQAILDDTDLLTKVSVRDLECIVQLLNRMKSLSIGREVEIIALDELTRDKDFCKHAAQLILQQEDMYSIYKLIYDKREASVEENLALCVKSQESNIFLDTKEQNGCARVGQSKLFTSNFPYFQKHAHEIRKFWLEKSQAVHAEQREIDLYIHMISTISSAQEVFKNKIGPYEHKDELWIWIPSNQIAQTHLNSFLANFQYGVGKELGQVSLEFFGKPSPEFIQIFGQHFPSIKPHYAKDGLKDENVAVIRFEAGKLNSRKTMISPFLPRLLA